MRAPDPSQPRPGRLLLLLAPTLLAWIVAGLLWRGLLPDPLFVVRIDLGNVLFFAGLLLAAVILPFWLREQHLRREIGEQTRRKAADERRRFLGRLDHELKNPLTAVRAGLANLAEAPAEDSRREALASVETQTVRLSRLAADLRKLAELETCPLERTPVKLPELLEEVFELAHDLPGAEDRHLTLTLPQVPWPLPPIKGDRDLLFLAIHNLLDNAVKFTKPGNTIEVRAFEDGATVAIEVADTGCGIPADELGDVWDELYRGKGARGIPGSGLGLALVDAIAHRHGGRASLRSRPGKGTVVTLRLPVT